MGELFTQPQSSPIHWGLKTPPRSYCRKTRSVSVERAQSGTRFCSGERWPQAKGSSTGFVVPPLSQRFSATCLWRRTHFCTASPKALHTTIYFPKAKAFHICLPPVNEQRRIVAKIEELFSDLDAGVAALERVRANLKRYRAAVLKAAVEGRLTEEWRKQHPATEPAAKLLERILAERRAKWEQDQLRRFKEAGKEPPKGWKERYKSPVGHEETSLPELPASWSWTSLSVVAWQVRDGPHHSPKYSPEGIPFITGGHVRPDGIDFTRAKFISLALHKEFSRRCEPAVGDLLYTKGGTTGIAHIVRDERAFSVWVHVAVLKLADSINRRYLQHMLNSPLCYRQAQKYTHGVGNQDLGLTRMIKIAISLPPLAEQAEIVAEVDRRLSVADAAETQVEHALQRAARLRQAILKRAFEGKLVPQDPTDEPAAALLERVATDGSNKRTPIGPQRRKVALAKDRSTR